ncbi:ATP-binding protein [Undibacterium sp. SXout7W]|uniref:ATP-binding protein n=1 Tax=Undibacterium sp. SXout7W TaxID=3413049 RepID=UPI003BF3CC20
MKRLFADTIFNRLFGLSMAAVFISHVATFILLFTFLGDHRPPPPPQLPPAINMLPGAHSAPDMLHGPFLGFAVSMLLQLFLLGLATWISSRNLARPMQELASAAQHSGGSTVARLTETGPEETRKTARMFNLMQDRIHQQTEEKARFLAAVSHDLRTPLTRIKLRTEQSGSQDSEKILQDVDEMRAMLDATLDYLRGSSESMQILDIQAMLEAIIDNMQEEGKAVQLAGTAQPLSAMPNELRRGISNVIENAVFYGKSAEITLIDTPAGLTIRILDQGSGIPEAHLDRVFDPFFRLADSRNRHSGGVGLGLSIAREIIRQHQGSLSLHNNAKASGLIALIHLPRAASLPCDANAQT